MKKFIFQEKGSIFIIALNVIIILTVFLFSFSFNSLAQHRILNAEIKQYQAYLNAKSGITMALKELKEGKLKAPFKKQYPLFDDGQYQADVVSDYVVFTKKEKSVEISPVGKSDVVRIVSVGKYKDTLWTITVLRKGSRQVFCYSQ